MSTGGCDAARCHGGARARVLITCTIDLGNWCRALASTELSWLDIQSIEAVEFAYHWVNLSEFESQIYTPKNRTAANSALYIAMIVAIV